ncbi:MAG: hypothetical protein PHI84_11585 [Kiritimatiellae bacterium]|nr:hypothetical protein [Kiritimatiellia bacterium]
MITRQFLPTILSVPYVIRVFFFILLITGFETTALAQIEEAQRIIYLAKAIKRIAIKQLNFPDPTGFKQPNTSIAFEVTAYDDKGEPVNLSKKNADELLKVKVKNPLGSRVINKDKVDFSTNELPGNNNKFQQIVKILTDKGEGAAKLEVRIADKYSKYSKAVGRQLISTGGNAVKQSAIKVLAKNTKNWIVKHPYISTGAGVVAVGGVAAAAGGGGGGGGGSSTTSTTGGVVPVGTSAYQGSMSGRWSGSVDGMSTSGSFTINIAPCGTVSGSYSGDQSSGSISGSVSGTGVLRAQGSAGESSWSGQLNNSGGNLSGSGSWSTDGGGGSWSGS